MKIIELGKIVNFRSCYKRSVILQDKDGKIYNRTLYGTVISINKYKIGDYYEI